MSTSIATPLAYRCTKCWQLTTATSDQVGKSVPCISCSTPVVVPAATSQTIKAGEEFAECSDTIETPKIELAETNLSDHQISVLAREKVKQQIRQEAHASGSFEALSCSRWKRLFGSIIDSIAAITSVIIGLILSMMLNTAGGGSNKDIDPVVLLVVLLVPAMLVICQGYLIAVEGRTIGKYCVKSKVVNLKGQPPGFFQGIIMRNIVIRLLGLIPFFSLVNLCWIFNEPSRCLHDYIAGTFVIDA